MVKKTKRSLLQLVKTGDVAGVRALVDSGTNLLDEMEDTSPLALAVENHDSEMVRALLDLGHNPDLGGIVVPLLMPPARETLRSSNCSSRGARTSTPRAKWVRRR